MPLYVYDREAGATPLDDYLRDGIGLVARSDIRWISFHSSKHSFKFRRCIRRVSFQETCYVPFVLDVRSGSPNPTLKTIEKSLALAWFITTTALPYDHTTASPGEDLGAAWLEPLYVAHACQSSVRTLDALVQIAAHPVLMDNLVGCTGALRGPPRQLATGPPRAAVPARRIRPPYIQDRLRSAMCLQVSGHPRGSRQRSSKRFAPT